MTNTNTSKHNKLKPCPFCGSDVEIDDAGNSFEISCCSSMTVEAYGQYGREFQGMTYKEILIKMWNRRVNK